MAKTETKKQRGWLNKSEMADSLGISPQAFEKWGVIPVARIGREAFFRVKDVLQNRLDHAQNTLKKPQPEGVGSEPINPNLLKQQLDESRIRLTEAQAYAQEQKNKVTDREMVPAGFATFALERIAAQIGSKLETVGKTLGRRHPEIDPRILETLEREIAQARNIAAQLGDELPGFLDEYLATLDL